MTATGLGLSMAYPPIGQLPLTVTSQATQETQPAVFGTAAEDGIFVTFNIYTMIEGPPGVFTRGPLHDGPRNAVVANGRWEFAAGVITALTPGDRYEVEATANVNGEPETAIGTIQVVVLGVALLADETEALLISETEALLVEEN